MLQFILGRNKSGKTYEIITRAADAVRVGETPLILVPEQYSFECEKQVLESVGEETAAKIDVMSFTRICDAVERVKGGVCGKLLSDADKLVFMKKALRISRDEMLVWGKYANSLGFASKMVETVNELKTSAVSEYDLLDAANSTNDASLRAKLLDTATVLKNFNANLSSKFVDGADRLTKLYENLETVRFFEDKTVFIDSFTGFSGQQLRIIDRIFAQCKNVTVALTCADEDINGIFENVKAVKLRLSQIAARHNIEKISDIVLNTPHYENSDMAALEEFMISGKAPEKSLSSVTVCRADTVYDEAEFVARNIRRLVRTENARYGDFVVISRDTDTYERPLQSAMQKNGVSLFLDLRTPLSATPVAACVLAAADMLKGITTEKLLRFYKCGIDTFSPEEMSDLENYIYLWNIDGELWKKEWDMDPRGFVGSDSKAQSEITLEYLNSIRERAILPILAFKKECDENAQNIVGGIYNLLIKCGADKKFSALSNEYKERGDLRFCDVIRQSWDKVIDVLDSLVICFGEEKVSYFEFFDSLKCALSRESVGVAPQTLEQVTFGAADRIRPSKPKYCFILGANQGVFPKVGALTGIFSFSDRKELLNLGIDIPDKTVYDAVNEDYLVYSNVCCPSKAVYLTSCVSRPDGTSAAESVFLSEIADYFSLKRVFEPDKLSMDNYPETRESVFNTVCRSYQLNREDAATLYASFSEDKEFSKRLTAALKAAKKPDFTITSETAQKLFGKKIIMSPTRFDNFNRCRFLFFCNDGLCIRPLQSASFDNMQRGTLVHYVLQRVIETYKKDVSKLNVAQISNAVDGFIEEYLSSVKGYKSVETPKFKFIVSSMARSLKHIVKQLSDEFAQSDFEPVACEVGIGFDGEIPEIKIPVDDMGEINITGTVDRVDSCGGYVRIIDYKTGSREFKLPDILVGQNMQMLIYLYAVINSKKYGDTPAGIFYMPAAWKIKESGQMHGLMVADPDLVNKMDKSDKGEFVPKFSEKGGKSFIEDGDFEKIFDFTEKQLIKMGKGIYSGNVNPNPVDGLDSPACRYCNFKNICMIEQKDILKVQAMDNAEVIRQIEKEAE